MIPLALRAEGNELAADGIIDRIAPINERQKIWGNSNGHWSMAETGPHVVGEFFIYKIIYQSKKLFGFADGVSQLPMGIKKSCFVDIAPLRQARLPPFAAAQLSMLDGCSNLLRFQCCKQSGRFRLRCV